MQGGKTVATQPTLIEARENARRQLKGLPVSLRQLSNTPEYPVIISAELQALAKIVDERNTS
jgi:nicotinate phosphoribosyltransferase